MKDEWMGIAEAAELIGVHPNTIRSWADKGLVPVHRTEGGHRRFRREDIEIWLQSQTNNRPDEASLVISGALWHTRFRIQEGDLESQSWYSKIDAHGREKFRLGGREILNGLRTYLTQDDESAREEIRSIGANYAYWAFSQGLSSEDATRAMLFFRRMLLDAMTGVFEQAAVRAPQTWVEILQKINEFADQILLSLLEVYEQFRDTTALR